MKFAVVALLILPACKEAPPSSAEPGPAQTTTTSTAPTATAPLATAPAPTASAEPDPQTRPEITIDRVDAANPVVIAGQARTFENNVVLRVRDARGKLIKETFTTAEGEMGQHSPYRGEIWLTRDQGSRITVEALEYSAKDGSERSRVRAEKAFSVEVVDLSLRLPNEDCTGLVSAKRRAPKSVAMARLLVEAVMEHRVFPKGSAVRSVNLRDGVLTVDFNERLQNVGGSCAVQMIRASVTETLMQLPSVKRVVITAGGSEKLALQP